MSTWMNIKSRESNPRQVDKSGVPEEEKGSGALEEEGVQGSQGGEKDNLFFLKFTSRVQNLEFMV